MINLFKKAYTAKEMQVFRFLEGVNLFKALNHSEMYIFLSHLYLRKYKRDEAVFFRGDPSNALYLVIDGEVSLTIDVNGSLEALTVAKQLMAFGDNALLKGTTRIYNSVVTSETAQLYVLPRVNIQEIFAERPRIQAKMLNAFAETYNEYTESLFHAYRDAQGFFSLSNAYQKE